MTTFPGLYCPGLIEAATPSSGRACDRAAFPGLYCPGLIEARPSAGAGAPTPPRFPGLYCPGLIEASVQRSSRRNQSCFRGSIAPASLKRRDVRHEVIGQDAVSGALLPRPH